MSIFQKNDNIKAQFDTFIQKTDKVLDTLQPYHDCLDLSSIQKVKDNFILKTEDFYRDNRKLNIGVIGQVKAGKSSFLNTLLFEGKKVLPTAATPKTATLTKIEYGEQNQIVIEFYDEDEWSKLEKQSKVDSSGNEVEAAKEIMKMVAEKNINPREYITKGSNSFQFESAENLMAQLDEYVGENGKYTAVTKNVTIQLQNENLKDISVVDTPGLNDVIASRTDRTRQFIEVCDVVFFLSQSSHFLDANDMQLIRNQLPQKGVKKLVMIASKFDSGIADVIFDVDSMEEAIENVERNLRSSAVGAISRVQYASEDVKRVLEACTKPVFVSSMCWNMANKDAVLYNKEEENVISNINEYEDVDIEMLRRIGNMDTVQKIFREVVDAKEETLMEKANSFIPDAEKALTSVLSAIRQKTEKTLSVLKTGDREQLQTEKKVMAQQINGVKSQIESVFGDVIVSLEKNKGETLQRLREVNRDSARINEKQGTETHVSSYKVSDSVWYKPSTWGTSHTEYSTYQTTYTYLDASDGLENIRIFSMEACSAIEKAFYKTVDINSTKRKLLQVIVDNFDASSETFDPAYFRLLAEQTLNTVEFPVMKLDVSKELSAISSKFTGEVRDSGERAQLRQVLSDTLDNLLNHVTEKFTTEILSFRKEIEKLKNSFADQLLENIENDYEELSRKFENKEAEIRKYEAALALLKMV